MAVETTPRGIGEVNCGRGNQRRRSYGGASCGSAGSDVRGWRSGLDDVRTCAGGLEPRGRSGGDGPASGEEASLLRTVSSRLRRHCSEFDDPPPKEAESSVEAFQGEPYGVCRVENALQESQLSLTMMSILSKISLRPRCVCLLRRCWMYIYLLCCCSFFFFFSCAG